MAAPRQHIEDVFGRLEKNMLAKALPYMFTTEPHEFQSAIKAMARKSLEKQQVAEAEKQAAAKKNVEDKEASLIARREDVKRCEELLAQRLRESSEKETERVEAANRIKEEEAIHICAQSRHDELSQERQILKNSKEEVDRALQGFSQLLDGKCENDKRDDAVNACLLHLLGASKVLQAAVPKALACEPSQRGPFSERVFEEVLLLLNEKSASKAASLRVDAEKFRRVSAEHLGAWAVTEQARDGFRQAQQAKAEAEGAHHAAQVVHSNVQEGVADAEKSVNYALSMQAIVDSLVDDVDKALSFITQLENDVENSVETVGKEVVEEEHVEEMADKENEVVVKRRKLEHVEIDNLTVVEPLTVANH